VLHMLHYTAMLSIGCVAVCCRVLQCVAAYCSVLHVLHHTTILSMGDFAVCYSVLHVLHHTIMSSMWSVAVCYSVLQRVAACLQRAAACCSVLQHVASYRNVVYRECKRGDKSKTAVERMAP